MAKHEPMPRWFTADKPAGWHSRRHPTREAQDAAKQRHHERSGPDARRRRALERLGKRAAA